MRSKWHISRSPERLVLSRSGFEHFDVSAQTRLPLCARARLAHQIRQDIWRSLQNLRGFSPVIEVRNEGQTLRVTAGGQIRVSPFPKAQIESKLASLLADRQTRMRWIQNAKFPEGSHV